MSSREKTQADFDLETFLDLFDTAISSDNPAVQRALKNLLLISTMVQSETLPDQRIKGPLRQVIDDIRNLNRRLERLEDEKISPQTPAYGPVSIPGVPLTWPNTVPNTGNPNWPPGSITCSTESIKSEDC